MQSQKHVWNTNDPRWSKWNGLKVLNGSLESTGIVMFNPAITPGGLLPPVMEDFLKLKEAFDKKFPGQTLNGSGYRTYIGQVNARMRRAGPGNPCGSGKRLHSDPTKRDIGVAASPGTSRHGWGAAVDLNRTNWEHGSTMDYKLADSAPEFQWLNKFAGKHNFVLNVTGEHWHISWKKLNTVIPTMKNPGKPWRAGVGISDPNITYA
jgi:hypothetical protein